LDAELVLLGSRRVQELAMLGPDWVKTGRGTGPAVARAIEKSVEVRSAPGGMMKVWFHDADPKMAQMGAQAITIAYYNYRLNRLTSDDLKRVRLLEDRGQLLASQALRLDAKILEAASEYGSSDLSVVQTFKVQEALRLEREVRDAMSPPAGSGATATTRPAPRWLVERYEKTRNEAREVARAQLKVQDLVRQRDEALREREQVQARIARLSLESGMAAGVQVVSTGDLPTTPAIDHRVRNAGWGALAGLLVFFVGRTILRMWFARRQVVYARTAFPLVTHYVPPRAVLPVDGAGNGEGAAAKQVGSVD
jgi:hypothetical protein